MDLFKFVSPPEELKTGQEEVLEVWFLHRTQNICSKLLGLTLRVTGGMLFISRSYWIKNAEPLLPHSQRAGVNIMLAGCDVPRGRSERAGEQSYKLDFISSAQWPIFDPESTHTPNCASWP